MTVEELLALLNDLPVDALQKDIYFNVSRTQLGSMKIESIVDEGETIGYEIVESSYIPELQQLRFELN